MRESRCRPEERMSWTYSACLAFSSPNMRSPRTSEKPMIAFSGVRSSWDMFARNSDLWRLAASSSRLFSSSSRKRRAFWMARADWVAKVFSRSTISGGKAPGAFRRTTRPPMIRSSRSERHRQQGPDSRSAGRTSRIGPCRPLPAGDVGDLHRLPRARPPVRSRPRPARIGAVRSALTSSSRSRWVARRWNSPGGLVVLVDRPAVRARQSWSARDDDRREHRLQVERRADRLADLAQRLELLDRARELRVRASSSWNRRTFSMAITAWAAKVSSSVICLSENGRTSMRRMTMTPIGSALPQEGRGERGSMSEGSAVSLADRVLRLGLGGEVVRRGPFAGPPRRGRRPTRG